MELFLYVCTIFFTIAFIVVLILYKLHKVQIKKLNDMIRFVSEHETNLDMSLDIQSKELTELAETINDLLRKNRDNQFQMRNVQKTLKTTLTSISHDLRTPLTSLSGYLQMIEKGNLPPEKQAEYIDIIEHRVKAVQKMLEQLFEYIRLENDELPLNSAFCDLSDILRDTLSLYYYDYTQKEVEPIINIPDEKFPVFCDEQAMTRVFGNIIYNSLIHGKDNYSIELSQDRDVVQVCFSNYTDTIEKNEIDRVFDRFYTSDQSKICKTTGLGLSIAKLLTSKMNGKISAQLHGDIFSIIIEFPKFKPITL